MTETTTTTPAPRITARTYLWILTCQWSAGGAQRLSTRSAKWVPGPDDTRADAFVAALDEFQRLTGADRAAVILFFSLEPNDL